MDSRKITPGGIEVNTENRLEWIHPGTCFPEVGECVDFITYQVQLAIMAESRAAP